REHGVGGEGDEGGEVGPLAKKTRAKKIAAPPRTQVDGSASPGGSQTRTPEPRSLRANYDTAGVAGTTMDRRLAQYRNVQRRARPPPPSHPELDGVEPEDLVGEEIDPSTVTMAQLATSLSSEGKVSQRAMILHRYMRNKEEQKKTERLEKAEATWRRRQLLRRKVRRTRNGMREERRERNREYEENGNLDMIEDVSADEDDSEEEFELAPDRITPPPEGGNRELRRVAPVRIATPPPQLEGEGEGEEDDDGDRDAANDTQMGMDMAPEREGDETGFDVSNLIREAEDENDAEDGTFAFLEGQFDEDESNRIEHDADGNVIESTDDDLARYREAAEERRRAILDNRDGRVVEEVDLDTVMINSTTHGRQPVGERWTAEETDMFFLVSEYETAERDELLIKMFQALAEVGENYTLMKSYFPGRTVKQLKRKGTRENKADPGRVTAAIMRRIPIGEFMLFMRSES
ncbi:hypothetical protein P7C73_g3392, partial [Tremellales sp. Uapishka_1]